jgi:hypothetical protein
MTEGINSSRSQYIEYRKSSFVQVMIFLSILVSVSFSFFHFIVLPVCEYLFTDYLEAKVYYTDEKDLSYYQHWRVVIEPPKNEQGKVVNEQEQEKVYDFDPLLTLSPVIIAFGFFVTILITGLLPVRLGLMRQKIEREIINTLHNYARIEYGEHTEHELHEIANQILKADIHHIHDLEIRLGEHFEDLEAMQSALHWRNSALLMKIRYYSHAMRVYLRNHFTIRYENLVMASIYFGAAILIIVIGLRGLQFIPKNSPSLVLLAIFLEFILLIFYSVTLIFTKHDNRQDTDTNSDDDVATLFSGGRSIGDTQRAERLLKMFTAMKR